MIENMRPNIRHTIKTGHSWSALGLASLLVGFSLILHDDHRSLDQVYSIGGFDPKGVQNRRVWAKCTFTIGGFDPKALLEKKGLVQVHDYNRGVWSKRTFTMKDRVLKFCC